jgi:hypothetical protein
VSLTAETVTVCAVFQLLGVKVSVALPASVPPGPATFTSAPPFTVTETLAVGCLLRTTETVSVAPPSVTAVEPPDCVTVTLAATA